MATTTAQGISELYKSAFSNAAAGMGFLNVNGYGTTVVEGGYLAQSGFVLGDGQVVNKPYAMQDYERAMRAQVAEMEAGLQLIVDKKLQRKGSVGRMDLKAQKCIVFNVATGGSVHSTADYEAAVKWVKNKVSQDRGEYVIFEAKAVIRPKPIETDTETL